MSPSRSSEQAVPDGEFQEIGGIRLHLKRWAPGEPVQEQRVLLIHGFGGSAFSWRRVGPGLSEMGFETVAVDLPGFGYSARLSPRQMKDRQWSGLMWKLLDRLAEPSAAGSSAKRSGWVLAGHSLGGRVVVRMALERPEDVRRVVFVDAALYGPPMALPLLGFGPVRWLTSRWLEHQVITERGVARLLESAYGSPPTIEETRGYLEPLLLPGTTAGLLRSRTALPEVSTGELERIEAPALIIWGEQDGWTDVKNALRLFSDLPTAEIFTIPGAGHLPIETHPHAVIRRLGEFLRSR